MRDENLISLCSVFRESLDVEAAKLERLTERELEQGMHVDYLEVSAYLSLIQGQRLHHLGYNPPPRRPPNTDDVEYHLTSRGGLYVVFELTRQEFPDLFRAKDRIRERTGG